MESAGGGGLGTAKSIRTGTVRMLFEGRHGSAVRVDVDVSGRGAVTVVAVGEASAHLAVAVALGVVLEAVSVLGAVVVL